MEETAAPRDAPLAPGERYRLVLVTVPSGADGERIARALVEERLAACVNVLPGVRSTYRWQGAVESAAEVLLVAKTAASRFDALRDRVKSLHPYELPEIVAVKVALGSADYLDWALRESGAGRNEP